MASKDILVVDLDALDALDQKARLEAIDDALHRLNFERRLTLLTDEQRRHMSDDSLSDRDRQRINECTDDKKRDEIIAGIARATYFRRCAWISFLNGETPVAPRPALTEEVRPCV